MWIGYSKTSRATSLSSHIRLFAKRFLAQNLSRLYAFDYLEDYWNTLIGYLEKGEVNIPLLLCFFNLVDGDDDFLMLDFQVNRFIVTPMDTRALFEKVVQEEENFAANFYSFQ